MTVPEILKSEELCRRFNKLFGFNVLPVNPYFWERLKTLDVLYNTMDKYDLFIRELAQYENEEEYFAHYNSVKEQAIQRIQNNESFVRFTNQTLITQEEKFPKKNLYSEENDGKMFISVDMNKANFSSLQLYDSMIFGYESTWEGFIGQFTTLEHLKNSKYVRQVILGACNPKRQIAWMQTLMNQLCVWINNQVKGLNVFSVSVDEIIFEITDDSVAGDILNALNRHAVGNRCKMDVFRLEKTDAGFIKHHNKGRVSFKCYDADFIHIHIKEYFGIPIVEDDMVFYHNGRLAKYI
jgi:hypothetical protein